ncbi:MAG: ATP phosphoribosyltransferase [Spirochaetota bacterium]
MTLHKLDTMKIAIPGKGRLKEPAMQLMKRAGYSFRLSGRNLYATCNNADITFIFVRADDIPVLVHSGVVDLGITGSDLVVERQANVEEILPLGFGKCRLCVAVKDSYNDESFTSLKGKTIATSFPVLTSQYFKSNGMEINCIEMNGSVEIMVGLNLADAIVDIVETGDSLRDNNLKIFSEIGKYQATLIGRKGIINDPEVVRFVRRLEGILVADRYSMLEYNIPADRLSEAEKITPGFESPTISRLDQKDWYAVKVMVEKKTVPEVMDRLEEVGATAILETKINNCRL